jgi:signal transduction histidine kinase
VWWDVAFYAIVALTAAALFLTPGLAAGRRIVMLAALVALVGGYLLFGRRAARTRSVRLQVAYLVLLVTATTIAVAQSPTGTFLLFAAFTQIWMLSDRVVQGLVFTVALATSVTLGLASQDGFSQEALLAVALQMGVVLVFSVGMGLWVSQSMHRTEELATTLDELQATREALATAHRAEGVAAERERMAQEIHDTLAQGFTSIVMLSQAARADVERGRAEAARDRLELVERTARDNLAEARALVAAFAPVGLTENGLAGALDRLASRFGAETGLAVELELPDAPLAVSREREVILLRAAQEALTNVRRHAAARRVTLALTTGADGSARLEVSDDGRGIEPEVAEGFGLRGMRDRVASGGGELAVAGRDEGGTRVLVTLPPEPDEPAGPADPAGAAASAPPCGAAGAEHESARGRGNEEL